MSTMQSVFVMGIPVKDIETRWLNSGYGNSNGYPVKTYHSVNGLEHWVVLKEYFGKNNLHEYSGAPASFDEIDNFIRTIVSHQIADYDTPIQSKIMTICP